MTLADNPLDDETESPLGEIVAAEWRVVRLEHTEPNGTRHIIERGMPLDELTTVTARPSSSIGDFEIDDSWQPGGPLPEYFDESGFPIDPSVVTAMLTERSAESDELVESPLVVGGSVKVDLPEHGISADFTVTALLPCPTPNPGDGCLVTTKFIHENAEIMNLQIEGSDEPTGTTAVASLSHRLQPRSLWAADFQLHDQIVIDIYPRIRRSSRNHGYRIRYTICCKALQNVIQCRTCSRRRSNITFDVSAESSVSYACLPLHSLVET